MENQTMEQLIRLQRVQWELLEKFVINYNKVGKDRRTFNYYTKRLKDFQELWDEAVRIHKQISLRKLTHPMEYKEKELEYIEKDVFSEMETHFIHNYASIEERFQKEYPPTTSHKTDEKREVTIVQPRRDETIKLPKISLERFSGDYKKWPTFYDLFRTLVHENDTIPNVQKLQYLKMHLCGEAEHLLRHLQVSEANYETAWNLLRDRYDNKRVLINTHLKTLLSQSSFSSETANVIKGLLDTTTESLQALENLGVSTSNWDAIVVYIIVQKLPAETHSLWEQGLANQKDLPTWKSLKEFLNCRFRTLEAINLKGSHSREKNQIARNKGVTQTFHITSGNKCSVCGGQHHIRHCTSFAPMNFGKKFEIIKSNGLCINCLGTGHIQSACPSKQRCLHCQQLHHTLLHRNPNELVTRQHSILNSGAQTPPNVKCASARKTSGQMSNVVPSEGGSSSLSSSSPVFVPQNTNGQTRISSFVTSEMDQNREILLATAMVKVVSPSGKEKILRALIDQGSQASFVTESVIQDLGLSKEAIRCDVSGVGQTPAGHVNTKVRFTIKSLSKDMIAIEATGLALKKLTHLLPSRRIALRNWEHIKDLKLADPMFYEPGKVDLLLGADIYAKIICDGIIRGNDGSPVAQETVFGWILSGEVNSNKVVNKVNNFHILADLNNQLKLFWELEQVNLERALTEEERRCEEIFEANCKRRRDGKYEVALPFNESFNKNSLGESRSIAVVRLQQMEKRFLKKLELREEYAKCMREYEDLGHMKPITMGKENCGANSNSSDGICYLPHHSVIKEDSTTTKLRVVFDASKETANGVALNDVLLKGPTVQDDLACLLLRWRKYQLAFTADIEKMYRQIWIKPEHADLQRIVWRKSVDTPIQDYKLMTVTFGTKSAPYLATRVLKQLAIDEKDNFPIGSQTTLTEFYVDDLLSGADTVEQALEKQNQSIGLLKSGGFNLRKWVSNCNAILENVKEEHRVLKGPLQIDSAEQVKALGLYWDPCQDTLYYSLKLGEPQESYTKRTILSEVAKLFDPLGWAAPSIVNAKILIQRLWLAKQDWDDPLPDNLQTEWLTYRKQLGQIKLVNLPRWIQYSPTNQGIEIHGFCDASLTAYAAVVYICIADEAGRRKVSILTAKTKVAPVKTVSLPRLELCSAALLARLMRYVVNSFQFPNVKLFAWTDSEIVLAWLKAHPSKWKTFVANRVSCIHDHIGEALWRHIPSKENPADCATRGLVPNELKTHELWWKGPSFLTKHIQDWPDQKSSSETNLECRKQPINCMQTTVDTIEERFSSLTKLLRILAYCYRFKSKEKGNIKATEVENILVMLIKKIQKAQFPNEINMLKKGKQLSGNSRLIKLTPFLHSDGLLRVGGRLQNAELSFEEKYPVILPDKCHLVTLILDKTHKDTLHGGPQLMMRVLQRRYWLLNARNAIRQHIFKCIPCFKQRAVVQTQLMGNLPRPRVTKSRPFSHVGIDYCGPFEIRRYRGRGSKIYKGYVAIFICMAVKAIHIEIVTELSAQGFVAAFRRFAARRGLPSDVYCDCGTNFVGGNTILTRQKAQLMQEVDAEVAKLIEREGTTFHFIPPASPHFGGLWESGVRSTKHHMKRVLGQATLTYEELSTVLTQIEACLNSRPISELSNDPKDISPLTPAHFLIGDILLTPPEPSLLEMNVNRLDRWQYIQRLYQHFWSRWNSEYLCRLQQRPKWIQKQDNVAKGDLVILKEDNLPPSRWLLGRIMDTHPGSDGLVRVVTIKTMDSILKRSITKICPLPINSREEANSN